MLRFTTLLMGSRAKGYNNRVMVYAHRRQKARYLMPKLAHCKSPLANKQPEEYGNTWDPRTGVEWMYRMKRRFNYRHWPWARWTDDPVRGHKSQLTTRTLSAHHSHATSGTPEWNYYAEVGQDYKLPSHFPLHYLAPFIYQYAGKVWTLEAIEDYLKLIEAAGKNASSGQSTQGSAWWPPTIDGVANNMGRVRAWNDGEARIPRGLLDHVEMLAADVVLLNKKKSFRQELHSSGVLRTNDMERYYALPYLRSAAAMPVSEEFMQPSGQYPFGKYSSMSGGTKIHPLQLPDRRFGKNMYPA